MAKILVADDSKTILKMVTRFLEDAGHRVIVANDGREAFEVFNQEKGEFDIVITDINMPHLNGLELVQKIRLQSLNSKVPMIVLSTEESEKMKLEGRKAGVSAWVVKPPKSELLLRAVDHFLSK